VTRAGTWACGPGMLSWSRGATFRTAVVSVSSDHYTVR